MQTRKKSHTKRKVNTLILLSKYLFLINVHTERKKKHAYFSGYAMRLSQDLSSNKCTVFIVFLRYSSNIN